MGAFFFSLFSDFWLFRVGQEAFGRPLDGIWKAFGSPSTFDSGGEGIESWAVTRPGDQIPLFFIQNASSRVTARPLPRHGSPKSLDICEKASHLA